MKLATQIEGLKPSATLALKTKATNLKKQGKNVIQLSVGEPDFPTPSFICDAAITAIQDGFTKYTAVDGISELKQAIIAKLKNDNKLEYSPEQIIVSCGAKHSLFSVLQAIINPGDEVIVPAPYWVSYPAMVELAHGNLVVAETMEDGCKLTPEKLRAAINNKTKALILNSPSNPTGMVYTNKELTELANILLEYPQVIIISDDIYEHICWNQTGFANIVNVCPELYDRTVVVNGVSKAYSMTGWRIGYAAGPAAIIKGMKKLQSHSTSNPTSIAQVAAAAALTGPQQVVADMVGEFKKRHDFLYDSLQKIPGIEVKPGVGAFYLFPNVSNIIKQLNLKDDVEYCEKLLLEKGLAIVPGTAFGAPGYVRISYAADMDTLKRAVELLAK